MWIRTGTLTGSFNVNFLKLSAAEKKKNIELAKVVPFAATNVNLKRYEFADADRRPGTVWQLLMAIRECGLKNDALMDSFYDLVMENYKSRRPYAVYIFHDRYDIPAKAADKERLGESETVFEYLICVICPLADEYEPGEPGVRLSFSGIYRWRRRPEPCCRVPEGCRQTASGTGEVDFAGEIIEI